MQWILENKEWVFSGIGILVITGAVAVIKGIVAHKRKKTDAPTAITQINTGTNNTQIGVQKNYTGGSDRDD